MSESHPTNPFAALAYAVRAAAAMSRAGGALASPAYQAMARASRTPADRISSGLRAARMLGAPRGIDDAPSLAAPAGVSIPSVSARLTGSLTGRPQDRSADSLSPDASRQGESSNIRARSAVAPLDAGEAADRRARGAGKSAGEGAAPADSRAREFSGRASAFQTALRAARAVQLTALAAPVTRDSYRMRAPERLEAGADRGAQSRRAIAHLDRTRTLFRAGGEILARTAATGSAAAVAPATALGAIAPAVSPRSIGGGGENRAAGRGARGARDGAAREALARAARFVEPRALASRELPARSGASIATPAVTINSAPTITVNMPAAAGGGLGEREISRAVSDALDGHAERIYEIVARVGAMRARTEF